jgi:hypothetical protein
MAHLEHRGMGGHDSANRLGNVVMLCAGPGTADHHGILDGRTVAGRRHAVVALLQAWLTIEWGRRGMFRLPAPTGPAEDDEPQTGLCGECGHDGHAGRACREVVSDATGDGGDPCLCGRGGRRLGIATFDAQDLDMSDQREPW